MKKLKYTLIKDRKQYDDYCDQLEDLLVQEPEEAQDEIELLTLLIEKWDEEHNSFEDKDPIELIQALMKEHQLKAKDLVELLDLSKGTISKILNYQKGLSKESIRKLSAHFKVSQEALNRHYPLQNKINQRYPKAKLTNTKKKKTEVE